MLYMISVGLVVLGAMAFIAALRIPGRIRMVIACLAACFPVATGIYLFQSSGLKISDLDRLVRSASREIEGIGRGVEKNRIAEQEITTLLGNAETSARKRKR
ncbi:MAG: hypothetical protein HYZ88_03330 [Candidatus Omnitrophica bacterium]|nr:hypothetical protein [Candidatus Omnitrophota bacterium]